MLLNLFKHFLSFYSILIIGYIAIDILIKKNILKNNDKTISDIFNLLSIFVEPILNFIKKFISKSKYANLVLLIFLLLLDLLIKFIK